MDHTLYHLLVPASSVNTHHQALEFKVLRLFTARRPHRPHGVLLAHADAAAYLTQLQGATGQSDQQEVAGSGHL
jgi:hypothetical protein